MIFSKLKSTLEKVRAKTGLKDPKDIMELCELLDLDENAIRYGSLPDGDSFYHSYVNLAGDGEMLVFVNIKTLRKAEKNENIAADGTFFIAPTLFKQVYMIHFLYKEKVCIKQLLALLNIINFVIFLGLEFLLCPYDEKINEFIISIV